MADTPLSSIISAYKAGTLEDTPFQYESAANRTLMEITNTKLKPEEVTSLIDSYSRTRGRRETLGTLENCVRGTIGVVIDSRYEVSDVIYWHVALRVSSYEEQGMPTLAHQTAITIQEFEKYGIKFQDAAELMRVAYGNISSKVTSRYAEDSIRTIMTSLAELNLHSETEYSAKDIIRWRKMLPSHFDMCLSPEQFKEEAIVTIAALKETGYSFQVAFDLKKAIVEISDKEENAALISQGITEGLYYMKDHNLDINQMTEELKQAKERLKLAAPYFAKRKSLIDNEDGLVQTIKLGLLWLNHQVNHPKFNSDDIFNELNP